MMLATPCFGGLVTMEFMQCLLSEMMLHPDRLREQQKYVILPYFQKGYSGLPKDRSVAASYALKSGADKILFIDSDQSWLWSDIKKLLDSDKEIVAGVIPLKQKDQTFNFTPMEYDYDCFAEEDNKITDVGLRRLRQKYFGQDEIEVCLTGTGFALIDCKVLKKMSETAEEFIFYDPHSQTKQMGWAFFQCGPLNKVYFGEDWAHFKFARDIGFKVYINSTVLIGHIGSYKYEIDRGVVFPNEKN